MTANPISVVIIFWPLIRLYVKYFPGTRLQATKNLLDTKGVLMTYMFSIWNQYQRKIASA